MIDVLRTLDFVNFYTTYALTGTNTIPNNQQLGKHLDAPEYCYL